MYKEAIVALNKIAIVCDEMGMMPSIHLSDEEESKFDKHFNEVFAEEFKLINEALERLAEFEHEKEVEDLWSNKEELDSDEDYPLVSRFFIELDTMALEDSFTLITSGIDHVTSLDNCYTYNYSDSPYEEPDVDYDDAKEVERIKLLIKITKHNLNSLLHFTKEFAPDITEESKKEIKAFMNEIFFESLEHVDDNTATETLGEYLGRYDV